MLGPGLLVVWLAAEREEGGDIWNTFRIWVLRSGGSLDRGLCQPDYSKASLVAIYTTGGILLLVFSENHFCPSLVTRPTHVVLSYYI